MTLSREDLKSTLWDAANTLRGSAVDRTDWKGYILPLLFFKRISDVWDEETAEATETFGDVDPAVFPEVHRFSVPEGCHWRDVRETAANVGAALVHAMQEIERANPDTLYRVFGTADWGNKEKFTDELLKDLIEGFSAISLGNRAVSSDVLGDAYEYLVGKFADVTRRNKAGEFYTPRSVVRMMVEMLDPKEGESIYDPACGTGGMLLGAIEHVTRQGGDPRTFFGKIYGQEKNLTTSSIARMNLVLHGIEDFQIAREDTLRNPAFADASTGGLLTFECVIANPPFSLKEWGRDLWEADPWGRAKYGVPPESYGDYAFVQHMIASMARTGNSRMAVVLPQGALFRKAAEGNIRTALLKEDLIEAVIGLAPNLFYGTQLAGCVVVLRRKKPVARRKKVLVIDASRLFRKGRAQNFLDPEHSEQIVAWYRAFEDVEDCAKAVSLDEIKKEGWTLNISRYVLPPIGANITPLPEAVEAFKTALAEARAAEDRLRTVLTEGGVAQVSAHLSQRELESHLWGGATLLRGLIDASDYKQYIFPLLFFKRLSDVWDEDYQQAFEDTGDAGYAAATANDRFKIPEGAHWKDVRTASRDVGRALLNAFQAIEAANPERLRGVFGNAPWTDKAQMPDGTLKNLIEHFSKHPLSLANVPEDELGNGYEYLIKQFADDSGHTAQEFYTNRTLVHLMAQMLEPQPGESIYDPTCGTGGMLISCLAEVKRRGGDTRKTGLYGQELINITAAIARMNLVLHGVSDFHIASGNTLAAPTFVEGDRLRTFDVVLANPPYSIKKWNRSAWESDAWGRSFLGTPPQGRADYAFFQHILKSMDPKTGRCAVLFPHGVLFRDEEAEMRRKLIEADLVECVLGVGPGLFYNSPMEACVVICKSKKLEPNQGRILFVDAVAAVARERAQSFLRSEHQQRILDAYRAFGDEPGFAAVATTDAVLANSGSLSIARYVKKVRPATVEGNGTGLAATWAAFDDQGREFWPRMDALVDMIDRVVAEEADDA